MPRGEVLQEKISHHVLAFDWDILIISRLIENRSTNQK